MAEQSLMEPNRIGKASTAHLPLKVHLLMIWKEIPTVASRRRRSKGSQTPFSISHIVYGFDSYK